MRGLVESAFKGGSTRVEAHVDPDDETAQRVATFAGLMREGVARGVAEESDRIVYARLADDTPLEDPKGFRSLLNSFLPRKRAISQMLIRSTDDRVLLCQLTYKRDFDLPGGVVEVSESPQLAVAREVEEELGLKVEAGRLLLTDWLPPWGGWDDAVCLVFDGGVHDPSVVDAIVRQEREIRSVGVLHDRRAAREVRRLHLPAHRVGAAQPHGQSRAGVHRERAGAADLVVEVVVLESSSAVGRRSSADQPDAQHLLRRRCAFSQAVIVQTATHTATTGQDSSLACAPVTKPTARPP